MEVFNRSDDPKPEELTGIRGWLIVPLIGLFITLIWLPITIIADYVPLFSPDTWAALTDSSSPAYHVLWAPVILFETIGYIAMWAASLALLFLFFWRDYRLPRFIILLYAFSLVISLVDYISAYTFVAESLSSVGVPEDESKSEALKAFSRACISAAIWIPYFGVSRRVKNTFTEGSPRSPQVLARDSTLT